MAECVRYQVSDRAAIALYNAALKTIGCLENNKIKVNIGEKDQNLGQGRKKNMKLLLKMEYLVLDQMERETRRQG